MPLAICLTQVVVIFVRMQLIVVKKICSHNCVLCHILTLYTLVVNIAIHQPSQVSGYQTKPTSSTCVQFWAKVVVSQSSSTWDELARYELKGRRVKGQRAVLANNVYHSWGSDCEPLAAAAATYASVAWSPHPHLRHLMARKSLMITVLYIQCFCALLVKSRTEYNIFVVWLPWGTSHNMFGSRQCQLDERRRWPLKGTPGNWKNTSKRMIHDILRYLVNRPIINTHTHKLT